MRVPASTYRLQLNADFTFANVREQIDYLRALGVGDLYFSPVFQARPRSPHGYDVTNPGRFNREVGDEAQFEELTRELHARGMGLLLDIVPNHMAASEENPWWRDILEHGPASLASHFFDVEWDAPGCDARVVLPVLGQELEAALDAGELRVVYRYGELAIAYFARAFPLDPATYGTVMRGVDGIDGKLIRDAQAIGSRDRPTAEAKERRRAAALALKERLLEWGNVAANRQALETALSALSRDTLAELIRAQPYKLEFWRTGTRRINYRRFFDITDLAGVRVEEPDVFVTTHSLILELISTGQIEGVRVDHVDGLRDPQGYLQNLRTAVGDAYVVVEKILAPGEELRESWPIEGTTGYDFTGLLAGFFCEPDGLARMSERYARRTGLPPFSDIVYDKKRLVMETLFSGELRALTAELQRIAQHLDIASDAAALSECIKQVSASLDVYRTYITDEIDSTDRSLVKQACNAAQRRADNVPAEGFALLRRVLLGEAIPETIARRRSEFIANWQQFTGPVMAKGLEDTSFYTYNRLIALSEVGAHPDAAIASVEAFHDAMARRAQRWPHTMNASSTHDTKRSEDVRARLQVLTEMPDVWESTLDKWLDHNSRHRSKLAGAAVPDVNEEILIYQTLLGTWPLRPDEEEGLNDRLRAFLEKAAREAKNQSSWLEPNEEYEKALFGFTSALLADEWFVDELRRMQENVAWFGALNSLAQLVIKIGAPGIPDIYQGNETWAFALVDPDNRRPVDFAALTGALRMLPADIKGAEAARMLRSWQDGRIKLHVTRAGLELRRTKQPLFDLGSYVPIVARGKFSENVVAFARRHGDDWILIVTGRFYSKVGKVPVGERWTNTSLQLPADAPQAWRNILTGEITDGRALEAVFATLPFAILST